MQFEYRNLEKINERVSWKKVEEKILESCIKYTIFHLGMEWLENGMKSLKSYFLIQKAGILKLQNNAGSIGTTTLINQSSRENGLWRKISLY
jgi:hypothetical protein